MMKSGKTAKKRAPAIAKTGREPGVTPEPGTSQGADIDRLGTMSIGELQRLYAEVIGEPTKCPTRSWLVRKIMEAAVPAPFADATPDESETDAGQAAVATDSGSESPVRGGAAAQTAEVPAEPGTVALSTHADRPATGPRLSKLDIPALQALYAETIGRSTRSTSRNYLVFKLRQAAKGQVPLGPRASRQKAGDAVMVLPVRMESTVVSRLDEAWRRLGLRSRMDLFRVALGAYFERIGERDLADLIAPEA